MGVYTKVCFAYILVIGQLCRNHAGNSDLEMKFVTRRKFIKQKRENWNRQQKPESCNLTINTRKIEA